MQFRVGVMVLATLLITGILALLFGELPSLVHGTYTLYVKFDEAPRVTRDTPVRKSGIRIGWVSDVQLGDDRTVTVTLQIEKGRVVYHDEVCEINASLMGDTSLDFVRRPGKNLPATPVAANETLRGEVTLDAIASITRLQEGLASAITSVSKTSDQASATMERITGLLDRNEKTIDSVIGQADTALCSIQKLAEHADEMIGDPETRQQLRAATAELPQVIKDTHDTINRLGTSIELVERNLQNVQGFTESLGSPEIVARLDRGTQNLDLLMTRMAAFSENLNNPNGSLGRLMNDPELYDNLSRTTKNIDDLSRQLKPIVNDVRVFTDKIARHPELVGVRGAISPSSGLK